MCLFRREIHPVALCEIENSLMSTPMHGVLKHAVKYKHFKYGLYTFYYSYIQFNSIQFKKSFVSPSLIEYPLREGPHSSLFI